jgi:hypothetical protein
MIRQSTQSNLKNTLDKISQENKIKTEMFNKNFTSQIYNGIDEEVETTFNRLVATNKKISKYVAELNDMMNNIQKKTDSFEICQYRKSKNATVKEIVKLFNESKNLLDFKYVSVKKSAKEKIQYIDKSIKSYNKQVVIYEKSVINSILSGVTNKSIVLRRFNKYRKRKELVCFKSASLLLKVDNPIFLIGFSLCGLYISSKTLYQSEGNLFDNINERTKIRISIHISELKEQNEMEEKVFDEQTLYGVLDKNDPTYQIYMKKAVYMNPEANYLIRFQNLDKNIYVDLWSGKVGKIFLKDMKQHLQCNCSKVNFYFSCANGFESDFDEFNFGIIANIIYSQIG